MRRSAVAVLVGVLTVAIAIPAGAAPAERERFIDDERFAYDCDGVVITEDGGHYEGQFVFKEQRDGTVRGVFSANARQVTASDGDSNRYRISGSGSGTVLWASMDDFQADQDPIAGHFGFRLVIRAADGGGKVGSLWMRIQVRPDGELSFADRGSCADLGPAG